MRSRSYRTSALIFFSVFLFSCATTPSKTEAEIRSKNERSFAHWLNQRDLKKASRFAAYFEPYADEYPELLAQYFLLTCQPQRAHILIERIESEERRNLFEAVLYALVSVERPNDENKTTITTTQASTVTPPVTTKKYKWSNSGRSFSKNGRREPGSQKLPFNPQEVWADEWAALSVETACQQMPIVKDTALRTEIQKKALIRFKSLPATAFHRDINVVALAMDSGMNFPNKAELQEKLIAFKEHPYYKKLLIAETQVAPLKVEEQNSNTATISLSSLEIEDFVYRPEKIEVPILTQPSSKEVNP